MTRGVSLALLTAVLVGCSMAPRYERPAPPVPTEFPDESRAGGPAVLGYAEFVREPRLRRLIAMALEESRELRIATLDAETLRARYRIRRAALLPTVAATAARNQQRIVSPLFPDRPGITFTQYSLSVGIMSYELDFFGRVQSLRDQALETYLASLEAQRSAELSLVASVATQYFTEQALREQLARAEAIRESATQALELTARSFEAGTKSALDLRSAEAVVAGLEAEIAALAQRLLLARNRLVQLVGRALPPDLPEPTPLATEGLLAEVRPGLPSHLLTRRPDILAAEHALKAQNANIGAMRAAFFPRISLTALGGSASADVLGLFSAGSGTWQFLPQVSIPLFAAGSRFAELEVSKLQKLAEVARYELTIQTAFREVADALASQTHLAVQREARLAALEAETTRNALADARYTAGVDNYLSVLTAQRDLFAAEQSLVAVRLEELSNKIALYRALGGGFE